MKLCRMETLEKRQLMASAAGTGLLGTYFNNNNFTGTNVSRVDAKVYFDFVKSPPPAVKPTTYSVRWTGQVKPYYTEPTTFYVKADDGVQNPEIIRRLTKDYETRKWRYELLDPR